MKLNEEEPLVACKIKIWIKANDNKNNVADIQYKEKLRNEENIKKYYMLMDAE